MVEVKFAKIHMVWLHPLRMIDQEGRFFPMHMVFKSSFTLKSYP